MWLFLVFSERLFGRNLDPGFKKRVKKKLMDNENNRVFP